jgi:hypothetical protein
MIVFFLILAVVVVLVLVGYRTSRACCESAPCQVVRSSGEFELRDYPALTVAERGWKKKRNVESGRFDIATGLMHHRHVY